MYRAVMGRAVCVVVCLSVAVAGAQTLAGKSRSIWVWPDATTEPIEDPVQRQELVEIARQACMDRLYVSVYQFPENSDGDRMYERADMGALIDLAHARGIEVWAAYGVDDWHEICVNNDTNCTCMSSCFVWEHIIHDYNNYQNDPLYSDFDGFIFDVEPLNADARLPSFYECARQRLDPGSGMAAAIRWDWDNEIQYPCGSGAMKRVYEHIIDMTQLDVIVPMCYRDFAGQGNGDNGVIDICEEEVAYAEQIGRIDAIEIGLETQCGIPEPQHVTFCQEDWETLRCVISQVERALGVSRYALHQYKNSLFKTSIGEMPPDWPEFEPSACEVELRVGKDDIPSSAVVQWASVDPAIHYDVIAGEISMIQVVDGETDLGPTVPLACDTTALSVTDYNVPNVNEAFFYVQRLSTQNADGDYGISSDCNSRESGVCP